MSGPAAPNPDLALRELPEDGLPVPGQVPADEHQLRPVRGKGLQLPPPGHVVEKVAFAGKTHEPLGPVDRFRQPLQELLEAPALEKLFGVEPEGLELEVVVVLGGRNAPPDLQAKQEARVEIAADGGDQDRPRVMPAD